MIQRMTFRDLLFNRLPWLLWGPIYRLATHSFQHLSGFRRAKIGVGSYVDPTVQIAGWRNVRIGRRTIVSEDCWFNVNFRDASIDKIIIGDFCHLGRRNFFSSGPLIVLKDFCFTGIDCHFLGCGHNLESPLVPYIVSGLSEGRAISIGVNCWLTTSVTVLEGVCIGHGSVIGARSLVMSNIPPFSIAVGNPCRVVKRFDFRNDGWVDVAAWSDELEQLIPTETVYRAQLVASEAQTSLSLLSASRRFGWI